MWRWKTAPPASGGCSPLRRGLEGLHARGSPRIAAVLPISLVLALCALLLLLNTNNLLYQVRSDLLSSLAPSESFHFINNPVVLYYLVLQKTGWKSGSKSAGAIIKSAYSLVCLNYARASPLSAVLPWLPASSFLSHMDVDAQWRHK